MKEEFKLKIENRIRKITTMLNIIMLVVLCWFDFLVVNGILTFLLPNHLLKEVVENPFGSLSTLLWILFVIVMVISGSIFAIITTIFVNNILEDLIIILVRTRYGLEYKQISEEIQELLLIKEKQNNDCNNQL